MIVILLIIIQSFKKESIFLNKLKYNVSVTFLGKSHNLCGFLDTGNLITVDNMPVIFINQKYYKDELKIYKIISVKTINNEKEIICYTPDSFYLYKDNKKIIKKVLIAFADLGNEFDCLLNYNLFYEGG